MSLYTPVFPSYHETSNSARKDLPASIPTSNSGKQQNYVEFLRDVHLFLSTQSDVLSPPSRPNSPSFDHRVQKLRDGVMRVFEDARGEPASGKWTRITQMLKLGCLRGRYWPVSSADLWASEEDPEWILPDDEQEWIEWEKKREEDRRLRGKTKASQQNASAASIAPATRYPTRASFSKPSQPHDPSLAPPPPSVSPTTLNEAKEKVRKWQATVASDAWPNPARGPPTASTSAGAAGAKAKDKVTRPQQSRTIDFAVVKQTATSLAGKKGRGSLARPVARGSSGPATWQRSRSPQPSRLSSVPVVPAQSGGPERIDSDTPVNSLPASDETPKIADLPETPYLPPSFPSHLETSTPLPQPTIPARAKPPPIFPLPASSSTPPPLTPSADPPDDRTAIHGEELHAANVPSSLPLLIDAPLPIKRPRALPMPVDDVLNDSPVTPPPKKSRTLPRDRPNPDSNHPGSMSQNGALDSIHSARGHAPDPNPVALPSHQNIEDSRATASDTPLARDKFDEDVTGADPQGSPEKIPSPVKSVKSYFSAHDSPPSDSPVSKPNLLLESPVSPMLSFAQNANAFLPQYTSTQTAKSTLGRTSSGVFGMGYSSQFDVERHVDRVSELLEKDVDFDGWLRDVPTVEGNENSQNR